MEVKTDWLKQLSARFADRTHLIGFVFISYSVTATRKGIACAKNYYSTSIDDTVEPSCNSYKPGKRETI